MGELLRKPKKVYFLIFLIFLKNQFIARLILKEHLGKSLI